MCCVWVKMFLLFALCACMLLLVNVIYLAVAALKFVMKSSSESHKNALDVEKWTYQISSMECFAH